ncbi:hypothetical protein OGAPHI_003099 [Ogataea philodendri]|uniref:Mediator of RNA polymerase II transcription subunit 18 n=1 Tax=Ogataea philodendri TaxID=1378263 RepID=A0A9P8P9G1_9ASCO|nr:uncharacterized protein OGAPHI_003099 [Ogataea philodendri]KAH3667450.1 hypothetical protein OGAPHI_003099 [Ogataea philodendri]
MVQQLSLYSSTLAPEVVLITLESLTGMVPQPMEQHTVVMRPKFPFKPEQKAGKINQIESYRIRMTRHGGASDSELLSNLQSPRWNNCIWTLQIVDIPAAGKRPVLTQNIYETTIVKADDILGYMDELGYMPEKEYWVRGSRFYYNDVVIEVFQVYHWNDGQELLDKQHQIKCLVNVAQLNDLESVARGTKQLEALKAELAGLVELDLYERTSLDGRVSWN